MHIKVGDTKVFDINLIYSREGNWFTSKLTRCRYSKIFVTLTCFCCNNNVHSGDIRIYTAKYVLKKLLQTKVSLRNIEREIMCTVIDALDVLYVMH